MTGERATISGTGTASQAETKVITTAVRRFTFCAAHRIRGHETKCKHLHGHNYQLLVHVAANSQLDELGRVIDFTFLKERIGGWIEENWDHGALVWREDAELLQALQSLPNQKIYILPANSTAENMALYLYHNVLPALLDGTGVRVIRLTLWETENCFVEISL